MEIITKVNKIFFAIPGSDLGVQELRKFEKGDKVLVELNGVDSNPGKFASNNPLLSVSWNIRAITTTECILQNELSDRQLTLEWHTLIQESPAVFEKSYSFSDGIKKSTIIPKLVAYYLPEENMQSYWDEFYRIKQLSHLRNSEPNMRASTVIVYQFIKDLNKYGWEFNSINRFALRAGVDINTVHYIRTNSLERILEEKLLTYSDLSSIYKATLLYSSFWKNQGMETGVDEEKVIDLPKWNDRK